MIPGGEDETSVVSSVTDSSGNSTANAGVEHLDAEKFRAEILSNSSSDIFKQFKPTSSDRSRYVKVARWATNYVNEENNYFHSFSRVVAGI